MVKLGEVCQINPKSEVLKDEMLVSFIPMSSVDEDGSIDVSQLRRYEEVKKGFTCFIDGDVLFAKITPCMENGKGAVVYGLHNGIGFGSTEFHVLRPIQEKIDANWLYYLTSWQVFRKLCEKNMTGSAGQKRVPKQFLENFMLNIPSLDEQQQQSFILKKVDGIIKNREKQLQKLDELVKARFVEMFGNPEMNPLGWEKAPLSKIIVNANNGMARRGNDDDGNIVMRLVELQDGYIDYSNPNRIILKDNEKKRYLLKDKDILFARVNGNPDNVGRCAVFHDIGEEVYHNDHIIRVHFDETVLNGTFASALFNSDYGKRQLKGQIKTSAGQYTVSQDGIGAIVAILPPMEMQEQFDLFVHQIDKSKLTIQQSLDKMETLKQSLMQEYFG